MSKMTTSQLPRLRFPSVPVVRRAGLLATVALLLLTLLPALAESATPTIPLGRDLGTISGTSGYRITGAAGGDQAGTAMQRAGDVNGDGLEDFILGAAAADPNGLESAGAAYIIYGRTDTPPGLLLATPGIGRVTRIHGIISGDRLGASVSTAGDFNGDGFDDVVIGAPGHDAGELTENGAAYVVFGGRNLPATIELSDLNGTNGFVLHGAAEGNHTGASVAGGADVNGDGFDDIVIGAPDAAVSTLEAAGMGYVVYGGRTYSVAVNLSRLPTGSGYLVRGVQADANLGAAVTIAGDVNRDGFADVAIAAPKASKPGKGEMGFVYVIYGKDSQTANFTANDIKGVLGFRIEGADSGHQAGYAAVAAGDVNGDGYGDLVIGAPQANSGTGAAFAVMGRPAFNDIVSLGGLSGADGFRLTASDLGSQTGSEVAGVGDVNGDGLDDVVVGAPGAGQDAARFAGEAYLVFGRKTFPPTVNLGGLDASTGLQFDGIISGDQAGQSVAAAGDTNGDGYDELLIGAPGAGTPDANNIGHAYLIYGGPSLAIPLPVTHPGTANNDILTGTAGNDTMIGGRGNDTIDGQAGDDVLKGGAGNDVLLGRAGADRMRGGRGFDTASYAGSSAGVSVSLLTGVGSGGDATGDLLQGIEGLIGSGLNDTLTGDTRNNTINGGAGNDTLTGGGGDDTFVMTAAGGQDTITDFVAGQLTFDRIDLMIFPQLRQLSDLSLSQQGANTLLSLPDGGTVTLLNVQRLALHADDFRFRSAPIAVNDNFSATSGQPLDVVAPGILLNDSTPPGSQMTAVLVSTTSYGTLTLRPDGSFRYVPPATFTGTDSFTYRADNGDRSNTAMVRITVFAAAPIAQPDNYRTSDGTPLVVTAPGVLANDVGDDLTAVLVSPTLEGTLDFRPDGSFTYQSATGFAHTDSFVYRATNGINSNEVTVTIYVLTGDFNYEVLLPALVRP